MVNFGLTRRLREVREEAEAQQQADSLEAIWARAEAYGSVGIYSSTDTPLPNRYCATITFQTISGTELRARSEHWMPLKEALLQAMSRAEVIRGQFK